MAGTFVLAKRITMLKPIFTILALLCFSSIMFACQYAYQFKIFPVGFHNDHIVTIDVKIDRIDGRHTGLIDIYHFLPWKHHKQWILETYISVYDRQQTLLKNIPLDTVQQIGLDYTPTLLSAYQAGIDTVNRLYPSLEYFEPEYISFCAYQQECSRLRLVHDSISNMDFAVYNGVRQKINVIKDSLYYAFGNSSIAENLSFSWLVISSIRVYKSGTFELVVFHAGRGAYIPPELIKEQTGKSESREYTPDLDFFDIQTGVYKEPVMHHGYGVDLFFVR